MKKFIVGLSVILLIQQNVFAQKTIWEELSESKEEQFSYFEKNDTKDVFKKYREMRGTKFIFACVNAYVFDLYADQRDSIINEDEVIKIAEKKCSEFRELSFDNKNKPLKVPLGRPMLLKFEKDFASYEGYIASKDKWTLVSKNNQVQIFVYKGKQTKTTEGFISRWVLSNFDLNSEFASGVTLRNFDCKQRKFKYVKYQTFDKKYGFGRKIQDLDGDSQWVVAPPGSLFEELVDYVCK